MKLTPCGGLSLVLSSVFVVVALSGLGLRNSVVWGAATLALLPILLGAVAWTYPARRHRDFAMLVRQRNALLVCLALLLSAPLTRWPLQPTFQIARPTLERLRSQGVTLAPEFPRLPCNFDAVSDLDFPRPGIGGHVGWLQRYSSRNPLLREVRLWHDGKSYVLFELQTRFGVVLRGAGEVDNSWEIVD